MGPELELYLHTVLHELREALGSDLAALILTGSTALDAVEPASDVDLIAVSRAPLSEARLRSLASLLSHQRIPCPARQLELVLYPEAEISSPAPRPRFALNLNTGRGRLDHVGLDPGAEPSHWFLIDLSIGRQTGVALDGPSPSELIGEPGRDDLLAALIESIDWHEAKAGPTPSAVLNACRAWRFVITGSWASKREAGAWASTRLHETMRGVIGDALAARELGSETPLGAADAHRVTMRIRDEITRR